MSKTSTLEAVVETTHTRNVKVGVDVGGTFTDIVLLDGSDGIFTRKISSSVEDYSKAIIVGLKELISESIFTGEEVDSFIHGTTVATNAILTRQGARTGLITTKGFRDILEIGRLRTPRLYDLRWEKPLPLVERYLRVEVDERPEQRR